MVPIALARAREAIEESWLAEGDEREQSRRVALAVKLKFQTSQPSCTTPLHGRAGGVMEMATTVEKRRGARWRAVGVLASLADARCASERRAREARARPEATIRFV